jgi:hypothetical protein
MAGPEFGPDKVGRPVIKEQALYGFKTSDAECRTQLTEYLADLNVSLRPTAK